MLIQHQSLSALWRQVAATPTQALNIPCWQDAALGDALLGRPSLNDAERPRIFCSRWPLGASATTTSNDPACRQD